MSCCPVRFGRGLRYLLKLKLAMKSSIGLGIFAQRTDVWKAVAVVGRVVGTVGDVGIVIQPCQGTARRHDPRFLLNHTPA